ncbi:MAG: hypothetical protein GY739_12520, partial [Mesoflavibacter sp.]|nr:hypothetical protein [Mesoflavibacter sp.]
MQNIQYLNSEHKNSPQNNPDLLKILEPELINEYTHNHKILSAGYPYLFPFGIKEAVWGTSSISKNIRKTWLLFHDHRFATDKQFIFFLFDQIRRLQNNLSVSFKIKEMGDQAKEFIKDINNPEFIEQIDFAINNPKHKDSIKLSERIQRLVKIIERKVEWSEGERKDTLGKLYALTHFFGLPTHFITISPAIRNNVLALRMTLTDDDDEIEIPPIEIRAQWLVNNPVAATYMFYRLMDKFFEIIIGLSPNDCTGRKIDLDALFTRLKSEFCGAFGFTQAYFAVIEEQSGGFLHLHGMLYGAWLIRKFQQLCHIKKFRDEFVKLLDSHITCTIPACFKKNTPNATPVDCTICKQDHIYNTTKEEVQQCIIEILNHYTKNQNQKSDISTIIIKYLRGLFTPFALQLPSPNVKEISHNAAVYRSRVQQHKHSETCWLQGYHHCRMAYLLQLSKK